MNHNILKFKTIAVATDLSHPASEALRYAQIMAQMYRSTLVVVHVIDPLAYAFPEGAPLFLAANQAAAMELKKIEEETSALGIPVHSVMESGTVCERILQAVKDNHADLLILGTRAKTEAGRLALGTVARQLLAKSRCPIMTISPDDAGNAADLIDRYVQKYAVDLLLLGSPERDLAEQDFHSSTVLQVISRVHCPVLCLPVQTDASTAEARHEEAILSAVTL